VLSMVMSFGTGSYFVSAFEPVPSWPYLLLPQTYRSPVTQDVAV